MRHPLAYAHVAAGGDCALLASNGIQETRTVTKKSDMASRYAAAHARREQRRAGAPARQYLPLAEEAAPQEVQGGVRGIALGRGASPTLVSRLPAIDYGYLRGDLMRTAILAVVLFGGMIILSFIIHV